VWLTLRKSARYADCSERTLARLIRAGLLRHARIGLGGRNIRLKKEWIDEAMLGAATPIEVTR
jgi:excisionase family DNA binding protein